ncbi:hypothetical protein K492DRAFT_179994 [Lichtheimia hyalospora FSU 10163]|nr:hypothetical protein K492DRAFT_179994 [Lichtheimia hyalospora FSU 10163]
MQKINDAPESLRGLRLLEHPHFMLLYVPGDRSKMKLVKPASDSYHRERIIQRIDKEERVLPHYALSHLWSISKAKPHMWSTIGEYVDDENGKPAAPVSMRVEKRKTLLALLNKHPDSYWWIDVLCARTDTPLAIMGYIYACCTLCYALIDCEVNTIRQLDLKRNELVFSAYATWSLHEYKEAVTILHTFTESKWWKRVWTWQEAVLPKYVILMPETLTDLSDYNMVDIGYLTSFYQNLLYSTKLPMELAGIFQFDIPRKNDPDQVWQLFLTELENYLADPQRVKISDAYESALASVFTGDQARRCNLLTASNMGDVYQSLLPK